MAVERKRSTAQTPVAFAVILFGESRVIVACCTVHKLHKIHARKVTVSFAKNILLPEGIVDRSILVRPPKLCVTPNARTWLGIRPKDRNVINWKRDSLFITFMSRATRRRSMSMTSHTKLVSTCQRSNCSLVPIPGRPAAPLMRMPWRHLVIEILP